MARPCPICDLRPQTLRVGKLRMDRRRARVYADGKPIYLTPCEFDLLEIMMSDPGRCWRYAEITHQLDPSGLRDITHRCVHQWVRRLRRTIGDAAAINTTPAYGYSIEPPECRIPVKHAVGPYRKRFEESHP